MNVFSRAAVILAAGVVTAAGLGGVPAAAAPADGTSTATVVAATKAGWGGPTAKRIEAGQGPAVVEQRRQGLAARSGRAAQDIPCWVNVSIWANANSRYVSMEKSYGGADKYMLRARATAVGPWEYYVVCRDWASGLTDFASQDTGLIVSTENTYAGGDNGMLRARATAVGPWERYYTDGAPGGSVFSMYAHSNGRWVSTENTYAGGDNGMLRARATAIGPWELYIW